MKRNNQFTGDFETTTDPSDCRVWAFALSEIGNPDNFIYGNSIEEFFNILQDPKINYKVYFHNLKFDCEFMFHYLINNGYEVIKDKKDKRNKTFTTLLSDMNQIYSIEIFFDVHNKKHINKAIIYDSLKILNFPVEQIAKIFDLPIQKLELDYNTYREKGHILTQHEIDYIRNDVEIMSRALKEMFDSGLTKMTIGSDALSYYKKIYRNFEHYYPVLPYEVDQDIRKSYRGGFTYLNPTYKNKETGAGLVLDVNSLYPSVMYNCLLPFSKPMFFNGKYEDNSLYPLYVQTISCSYEIKDGMIPTIQIKNNLSFNPTEYSTSSEGEIVTLTLTSVDLELFFEHYNVYDLHYHSGWMFKAIKGMFTPYIDFWMSEKIKATEEGNKGKRQIAKLMLNSLYGKFGLNPNVLSKYPVITEDGSLEYDFYDPDIRKPIYIPVASFITSYARKKTIETSHAIKTYSINKYGIDKYVYSDTDSIHTTITDEEELKQFVDIDDVMLGAWKKESEYVKGKYIRAKSYIEMGYDGKLNTTVAGLPKYMGDLVTFENFNPGAKYHGKLVPKHVPGGVVLVDVDFTIKDK